VDEDLRAAAAHDPVMGFVAGWLFLAGSALCVVAMLLPHSARVDGSAIWIEAGATALASLALLVWARRLPRQIYPAVMLLASALITVTMYFNGERLGAASSGTQVYYVWVALYAGYFFTRSQIAVQLAAVAILYASILSIVHVGSVAPTRWLLTVAMVCGCACLVYALKHRNDQLVARLRAAVRRDPLTGIANRKAFDERLAHELAVTRRGGHPTAVVLLDIDRFKQINDRHGHVCGDDVLRTVAEVTVRSVRETDLVARLGGDEFAAILPGASTEQAYQAGERVRLAVLDAQSAAQGAIRFTISVGVADSDDAGEVPDSLVSSADHALYSAKRNGRNRTARSAGGPVGVGVRQSGWSAGAGRGARR
jgi:diguanylate cyclase (GGDEF)-like protein